MHTYMLSSDESETKRSPRKHIGGGDVVFLSLFSFHRIAKKPKTQPPRLAFHSPACLRGLLIRAPTVFYFLTKSPVCSLNVPIVSCQVVTHTPTCMFPLDITSFVPSQKWSIYGFEGVLSAQASVTLADHTLQLWLFLVKSVADKYCACQLWKEAFYMRLHHKCHADAWREGSLLETWDRDY